MSPYSAGDLLHMEPLLAIPNAMKSLITSDIVPDYTIIKIFVTSTTRAAVIFMKGIINGKIECLP